jgi:hypothetical protein
MSVSIGFRNLANRCAYRNVFDIDWCTCKFRNERLQFFRRVGIKIPAQAHGHDDATNQDLVGNLFKVVEG